MYNVYIYLIAKKRKHVSCMIWTKFEKTGS